MLDVLSDDGDTKEKALVSKNIISGKGSTFNRDENAEDLPSKVKDEPVDVNKTYKIGSILAEAFYNFNKGKERDRYKEGTKIAPKPQSRALEGVNLSQKKITRSGSGPSESSESSESSGGLFDNIGSAIDSIQDIVDNVKSVKKLFSFTRKRGGKGLRRLATRKIGRLAGRKVAPKVVAKTAEKMAPKVLAKTVGKAATKVIAKTAGKSLLKKIPLIGAGVGALFAAQRAMQGDFLGAGLELVSGISSIVPGIGTAVSVGVDAVLAANDIKDEEAKISEENLKSQLESRGVASTEELYAKKLKEKQKEMLGEWDVNRDDILDSGKVPVNTPPSIQPNVTPMVPPKREVLGKVDMPSVKPSTPIVDVNLDDQNSLIKQQTNVMLAILDVAKKQLLSKGGEASIAPPVINVSPQQPQRENVTFTNGRDIYLSSPYSLA